MQNLSTHGNTNKKDYLYKVAKIKENHILHEKKQQEQFKDEQSCHVQDKQKQSDGNEQFDFCIPDVGDREPEENKQNVNGNAKKGILSKEDQKIHKQEEKLNKNNGNNHIEKRHQNIFLRQPQLKAFVFQEDEQQITSNQNNHKQNVQKVFCFSEQSQNQQNVNPDQLIQGITITNCNLDGNVTIKITDKKQLILSKLPPGVILKCVLRRSTDIFNPEFDFYLNNGMKHLLSAKKNTLAKREIFKMSLQLGRYKNQQIIGSIFSNAVHNCFWIYSQQVIESGSKYQAKGVVKFQKPIAKQQRPMITQLFIDSKGSEVQQKKLGHEDPRSPDIILRNQISKQKQNSTKNFTLIDEEDSNYHYLKMFKKSQNMFQVQIQHPLNPLQAFAIALTRFDAQIK